MLKTLIRMFSPPRLEDPFFGSLLVFHERKVVSYWEGHRHFGPLGKKVELIIHASDPKGPTHAQQQHFQWIENEYQQLCEAIAARFRQDSWAGQLMDRGFESEFTLSSMSIPPCRDPTESWELSFEAKRDIHLFTITMVGKEPTTIVVDG